MVLLIIGNALFSVCGVMTALYAKYIIDAAQNADKNALIKNGVALGALILLQTFLKVVCKALEARVQGKIEISIKTELFSSILKKDYEKITSIHTGELMTRLTSDVSVVSDGVVTILPSAVAMVTRLVCAFAALFSLDRRSFAVCIYPILSRQNEASSQGGAKNRRRSPLLYAGGNRKSARR